MTKMIKMSLIAATAVAGLTTTSSAVALEEAIKNTDLSGYIRYRYTNGEANAEANEYKTVFKIKSKVNDNVNAFIKAGGAASTTETSGDADPDTTVIKEANFQYSGNGLTVIAGKQGLQTPFADIGDQQGTGIVALYPVGGVTLAFGHYLNSDAKSIYNGTLNAAVTDNDIGGNNITALAAIGAAGPVNYAAWYATVSEDVLNTDFSTVGGAMEHTLRAGATAINLNVSAKVGPATVSFNHATVDYSLNAAVDAVAGVDAMNPTQTRLVASAKAGPANVTVGYVATGDEGGDVTLGDTDASSNFVLEDISASALADAGIMYIGANANVAGVKLGLEYLSGDGKLTANNHTKALVAALATTDVAELKLSAAYAMSKNFTVSAFITDSEIKTSGVATPKDKSRIELKYTF